MILKILQYLQQHKTNILLNVNYDIFNFFFHVHNRFHILKIYIFTIHIVLKATG